MKGDKSMKGRDMLIAIWKKCNGVWEDIFDIILNKKTVDFEFYLQGLDTTKYITMLDDDYPIELTKQYHPPFVLEK